MRFLLHLCYLFFLLYAPLTFGSTPSVDDILQKADEVRNPSQSYSMKVRVLRGEAKEFTSSFEVFIQGNQKTLIRTLEPNRDQGRNLLMLGEEMWAFIPNLNRSVRVSLSQKLTGEAANGDLSRMRWSGDYSAVIEKQGAEQWTLLLTARKKGLTYERIRIWVDKDTFHPKKAEFLTLSDQVLKRATYENYSILAGKMRPTLMRIQDALRTDAVSWIQVDEMKTKKFPESLFNQNSLK